MRIDFDLCILHELSELWHCLDKQLNQALIVHELTYMLFL